MTQSLGFFSAFLHKCQKEEHINIGLSTLKEKGSDAGAHCEWHYERGQEGDGDK